VTGFRPAVSLDEGIRVFVEWYQSETGRPLGANLQEAANRETDPPLSSG